MRRAVNREKGGEKSVLQIPESDKETSLVHTHVQILVFLLGAVSTEETCEAPVCTIESSKVETVKWVQCEGCTRWFHLHCLGLKALHDDDWFCSVCL